MTPLKAIALLVVPVLGVARSAGNDSFFQIPGAQLSSLRSSLIPKEECPPCFNCLLPAFTCGNYGSCNEYDGQCQCPEGWGGIDCLTPQCDSLGDGNQRHPRPDGKECECKDGWGGINCNVCQSDQACEFFPLGDMSVLQAEPIANMTCYKGGETVRSKHQMCDVTNRKILDMLPGRPPQVTFSCEKEHQTCAFQFWIGKIESFYCALDTCKTNVEYGYNKNTTTYSCEHIKCSCVPGRMLCGEDGSVDISDFLVEEIKGPAEFSCKTGGGCKFEEPAMNDLINDIFGDKFITLACDNGECLHYSQVPGYLPPPKPDNTVWIALSSAAAVFVFVVTFAALWYVGRSSQGDSVGQIRLPADEAARLMTDHVPATLHFSNLSYILPTKVVLDNITGSVKPGQVMAIMGASGAGKSTFLDILARKTKMGRVAGKTLVNGREVSDRDFKKVVGFVDQEDTLMSTLTVYETVLYSALLRLPREMSLEAKKFRTLETMKELGILSIKNSRIGSSGKRSISGGEKRRVSIACELVTSPSILFLDEPTSGLDAFNAFNVVESLVSLARNYNRTVIFTIHQPRSNIVALFDQLVLLALGKLVYSGPYSRCQDYFEGIGHPCPPGFNIADYLIDLTTKGDDEPRANATEPSGDHSLRLPGDSRFADEERGLSRASPSSTGHDTELQTRLPSFAEEANRYVKHKTSQLLNFVSNGRSSPNDASTLSEKLRILVQAYLDSDVSKEIQADITSTAVGAEAEMRDVVGESSLLRGHQRASWTTQFRILSGRAFKNLYRDPALLAAHYVSSIAIALMCGFLIHHVSNDMSGFQNRLGFFFFTCALFGFSCLSSLGLFANERILFMRERANGYYSSFTYFSAKVLFDIVPLRVVPPLVYGSIVYGLVGLVPEVPGFWKFLLTLVLFNLTTASVVLFVSVAFADTAVASLVGTLIMLFNLLFAGLLINRDTVNFWVDWLHTISFFHAAYEALAVNELRYLQLKEIKYGVELDVPAATILSLFAFRAQAFWWDITLLGIMFSVTTVLSYAYLHFYVRETR